MGNLSKETPLSEITATIELLDHLGVERKHLTLLRSDGKFAKQVAEFICNSGIQEPPLHKSIRIKMGEKNMFGIPQAVKYLGITPTIQQLAALEVIPFSDDTINACKKDYILVANFGLSIFDIRNKVGDKLFSEIPGAHPMDNWYLKQKFTGEIGQVGWILIRKTEVPESRNKDWKEQQRLLSKDEYVPTAQEMTYAIIGHFLNSCERLFEYDYVRCTDFISKISGVYIGNFTTPGLRILKTMWDHRYIEIGVAAARKQDF
ncbi:MAG: hypothetical protein PHE59_04135 [Patescibacteria group bacterium]|nr:hypothetical protein [Patescibacteria group bacterium]MDD5164479.1 hypothetical protein [Patescibacteria group bacterium]MDD5534398.1 hypothetical protein [Patescibacteria group bacterium]